MHIKMKFILLFSFICIGSFAREVQIQTKDSLIRNDVFDAKRERIDAYRQAQALRELDNQSLQFDISNVCLLLKKGSVIYFCAQNGRYYKQIINDDEKHYQRVMPLKIKQQ
ncbi:hypothetical protein JI57_00590 [Psychromonas sp. PRT-SC03]|nr:hypothetical protein JI57_00590 [Psychromonas sp. PRT-SC03]